MQRLFDIILLCLLVLIPGCLIYIYTIMQKKIINAEKDAASAKIRTIEFESEAKIKTMSSNDLARTANSLYANGKSAERKRS
jgi:hypothetical protein